MSLSICFKHLSFSLIGMHGLCDKTRKTESNFIQFTHFENHLQRPPPPLSPFSFLISGFSLFAVDIRDCLKSFPSATIFIWGPNPYSGVHKFPNVLRIMTSGLRQVK